jgi:ribosomal protein S17E
MSVSNYYSKPKLQRLRSLATKDMSPVHESYSSIVTGLNFESNKKCIQEGSITPVTSRNQHRNNIGGAGKTSG